MTDHLTDEDREALYADDLRFDNLHADWARESLEATIRGIVARHVETYEGLYVAALERAHAAEETLERVRATADEWERDEAYAAGDVAALAAELAGTESGADYYAGDWHEALRSDDPYCWADPEAVAEAIVRSRWLAADRAAAERRGAEKALREAATAWQVGGWADVLLPHPEPPANPTIARSSRVLDWLRARADQIGGAR